VLMETDGQDLGDYEYEETGTATLEFYKEFRGIEGISQREEDFVPGGDLFEEEVEITLNGVQATDRAGESSFGPFVVVIEGPDSYIESEIATGKFGGDEFSVEQLQSPARWFFSTAGLPAVFAETAKPLTATASNVHVNSGGLVSARIDGDEGETLGVMQLLPGNPGLLDEEPDSPNYGFSGSTISTTITGKGLKEGAVSFGDEIIVTVGERNDTRVDVSLQIDADAFPGARNVTVGDKVMPDKFTIYSAIVRVVDFVGDDAVQIVLNKTNIKGNDPELRIDYWRSSTKRITYEFVKAPGLSRNRPAMYPRNKIMNINAGIQLNPRLRDADAGGVRYDLQAQFSLDDVGGGDITWTKNDVVHTDPTDAAPASIQLTTTDSLPNVMVKLKQSITWKVRGPGAVGFTDINSTGDHVVYVAYAEPEAFAPLKSASAWTFHDENPNYATPNRLAKIYDAVPDGGTADFKSVVAAMHQDMVSPKLQFIRGDRDKTSQWVLWSSVSGGDGASKFYGQCAQQARLLQRMANMIGIKALHLHVRASSDEDCLDFETLTKSLGGRERTLHLYMDFNTVPDGELDDEDENTRAPAWNAGEGTLVVPTNQTDPDADAYRILGKYHLSNFVVTVQGSPRLHGDLGVLLTLRDHRDIGITQRWVERLPQRSQEGVTKLKMWLPDPTTPVVPFPD